MLINSLCIDDMLNIHIASENDICNMCLDEFVTKNKATHVIAREQLKGKLKGERIFKLRFHGGTYVLCEHHIQQILDILKGGQEEIEPKKETRGKKETEQKKETKGRKKQDAAKDMA